MITLSDRGYIKRLPIGLYRLQRRGGKGVRGQERREGDAVQQLVVADTHDYLLFFTDKGRVYRKRVFDVGEDSSRQTRGTPVQNLLESINPNSETVTAVVAIPDPLADLFIFMVTRKGKVKKMHLDKFQHIRRVGLAAFDLEPNDSLHTARLAEEGMTAVLISRNGKGVQFSLDAVTERQGRSSGGVGGMRLLGSDEVVAMEVVTPDARLLIMSELGYGKAHSSGNVPHHRTKHARRHRHEDNGQDRPHRWGSGNRFGRRRDHRRLPQRYGLPHVARGHSHARSYYAGR